MPWDITSLVQSVNLICAKKVYRSNRPKYSVIPEGSAVGGHLVEGPAVVLLTTQFSLLFFWKT